MKIEPWTYVNIRRVSTVSLFARCEKWLWCNSLLYNLTKPLFCSKVANVAKIMAIVYRTDLQLCEYEDVLYIYIFLNSYFKTMHIRFVLSLKWVFIMPKHRNSLSSVLKGKSECRVKLRRFDGTLQPILENYVLFLKSAHLEIKWRPSKILNLITLSCSRRHIVELIIGILYPINNVLSVRVFWTMSVIQS